MAHRMRCEGFLSFIISKLRCTRRKPLSSGATKYYHGTVGSKQIYAWYHDFCMMRQNALPCTYSLFKLP
jgi:hypothetical protein